MIGNFNDFYIGKKRYRWYHGFRDGGVITLVSMSARHGIGGFTGGYLKLEKGQYVFHDIQPARVPTPSKWPTGTACARDAKQIVQVRLTLEVGKRDD